LAFQGCLAGHEGADYTEFLNEHGIDGIVLQYRLGCRGCRHPAMLQDAVRAVWFTGAEAAKSKILQNRVGVVGSSAGGHLASTLLTIPTPGTPNQRIPWNASPVGRISGFCVARSSP
jgi:acetyl esterase/lipase